MHNILNINQLIYCNGRYNNTVKFKLIVVDCCLFQQND